MLVLSRKVGETIVIGGRVRVTVVRVDGEVVRLGIAAPNNVPIHRQEVFEEIQRNNRQALTQERPPVPKLPPRHRSKPNTEPLQPAPAGAAPALLHQIPNSH